MTACSKSSTLITYDEKVRMVRTKAVCQRQRLLLRERMAKQTTYQDSSVVQLVYTRPLAVFGWVQGTQQTGRNTLVRS
jgi:hypothetical protein